MDPSQIPWMVCLTSLILGVVPARSVPEYVFKIRGTGYRRSRGAPGWLGWKSYLSNPTVLAFPVEVMKGGFAVFLATDQGIGLFTSIFNTGWYAPSAILPWAAGLCAVIGQVYSPFQSGSRGVEAALGVMLVLAPWAALASIVAYLVTLFSFRQRPATLPFLIGLLIMVTIHLVIYPFGIHLWPAALIILLILVRHETEIDRLLQNGA